MKARGVIEGCPEWLRTLARFDQRRALNPPGNPRRVAERIAREMAEFIAEGQPKPETDGIAYTRTEDGEFVPAGKIEDL